ncbi:triacylglycerol lipase [Saccharopolyspora erythraea]|uniref:esterase/lipase family protein n=1 Tax=Saccharopolyspora erythraea TaxID=1836 RepID=UPI001BA87BCD|nr:triacylglycerol lipase [Saccharopolyspora erythraea]QUH02660.1 triacylglycerol lipase [Saccharopolyspora erythraea]
MRRTLGGVLAALALATAGPVASADDRASTPVVFVHGYSGAAWNWNTARDVFRQAGYGDAELFSFEYDSNQSNERSAAELAAFVDRVLAETGAHEVDIVNHSMGALVSRWYIKELGGVDEVGHWTSLAGANHGTHTANLCQAFPSCREMLPGSAFVERLNSGDETPGDVEYTTWFSPADGVIVPYTSTAVEGARNNEVPGVSHLAFLSNAAILRQVATGLAG